MNTPSGPRSLHLKVTTSSPCDRHKLRQQQQRQEQLQEQLQEQQLTTLVSLSTASATTATIPLTPTLPHSLPSSSMSQAAATSASYQAPLHDGTTTSTSTQNSPTRLLIRHQTQTQTPTKRPRLRTGSKRKRQDRATNVDTKVAATTKRKKTSTEFLRKGQWTPTEERLARLLIEAFEEGRLPIYTGIRLRGYLAVQLQCDPMRVSKKLCAGTIDHKHVPKNYGQKKFKLRKKVRWESEEMAARLAEIKRLTKTLWVEARVRKPAFLTLSSTRNVDKRQAVDETVVVSSPPSPIRNRSSVSTPKTKKRKVLPILYFNLSKLKRQYVIRDDDSSSSSSELTSPVRNADSDSEPVRLDGESLQAAYDLLTLCSPQGASGWSNNRDKDKWTMGATA
uniref:Uncharacterized protein n=1 Tax=Hyaloperonospora arabidopsidis (strain Emoy2) TaxID=559515 RepID=M4BWW3_HYAAE